MNFLLPRISLLAAFVLIVTTKAVFSASTPPTTSQTEPSTYSVRGVVEKIAPDHRSVTIHHQAIPGYMMEMTMDFPVKNPQELEGIAAGDKISFTLNVTAETAWINHILAEGHANTTLPLQTESQTAPLTKLTVGDKVPDGDFVTEDGRTLHFSDFRGKVMAVTFFFTRCLIPDYCPLMNRNFEKTRALLLSSNPGSSKWQLLSLSFDGAFDNPRILTAYAKHYRSSQDDRWLFGTASPKTLAEVGAPLGLKIIKQGDSIAHNLRTLVLDADGRVIHQFNDNSWTPSQLVEIMQAALAKVSEK